MPHPLIMPGRRENVYAKTSGAGCQFDRESNISHTVPRSSTCVVTSRTVTPSGSGLIFSPRDVTVTRSRTPESGVVLAFINETYSVILRRVIVNLPARRTRALMSGSLQDRQEPRDSDQAQ